LLLLRPIGLHAARQTMVDDELDAASAAFEVGYQSPSQFNREYKRLFGQPPMRDIQAIRASARARPLGLFGDVRPNGRLPAPNPKSIDLSR
jgi:AraC-like DNA-binding protein